MTDRARPYVIPPGQEERVRRMVEPPGGSWAGWSLAGMEIGPDRVRVAYRHTNGDTAQLALVHPTAAGEDAEGAPFRVEAYHPMRPELDDLVAALRGAIRERGTGFRWHVAGDPRGDPAGERAGDPASDRTGGDPVRDTELLALEAGLKPAIRRTVTTDQLERSADLLRRRGLVVRPVGHVARYSGVEVETLCASTDAAVASELADLEAATIRGDGSRDHVDMARHIGALLGYPTCCVEAFAARLERKVPPTLAPWTAVRDAWTPRPEPRLNHLAEGEGAALISFEPCRYDCARALEQADAVADLLGARHPAQLAQVDRTLARDVAIHPKGHRAWVTLSSRRGRTVVAAVEPIRRMMGRPLDESVIRTVRRWNGRPVGGSGRIRPPYGWRPARVVPFGAADRGDEPS